MITTIKGDREVQTQKWIVTSWRLANANQIRSTARMPVSTMRASRRRSRPPPCGAVPDTLAPEGSTGTHLLRPALQPVLGSPRTLLGRFGPPTRSPPGSPDLAPRRPAAARVYSAPPRRARWWTGPEPRTEADDRGPDPVGVARAPGPGVPRPAGATRGGRPPPHVRPVARALRARGGRLGRSGCH